MESLRKKQEADFIKSVGGVVKQVSVSAEQQKSYEEMRQKFYSGEGELVKTVKEARALAASSTLILN